MTIQEHAKARIKANDEKLGKLDSFDYKRNSKREGMEEGADYWAYNDIHCDMASTHYKKGDITYKEYLDEIATVAYIQVLLGLAYEESKKLKEF